MHARSRKIPLAAPSSRDEIADAFPPDDGVVIEIGHFAEAVEETRANERFCLACGGDGSRHEGCDHAEVARLLEPSRSAGEMIARLRRAAAEHRAASRALRALVTSELNRERAELETRGATVIEKTPIVIEAPASAAEAAAEVPCLRCAEREGEGAVVNPPRAARKRARKGVDQQSLPFVNEPAPAAGEDRKSVV
jgi:hypothetical protein